MAESTGYYVAIHLHQGRNLPKADTMGKIDAYVKVNYGKEEVGKTKIVDKDYDPKWKKTVVFHADSLTGQPAYLRLYDDDIMTIEKVATLNLTFAERVAEAEVPWNLEKGFKPHRSGSKSTLVYSVGWIKDAENLFRSVQGINPHATFAEKKRVVVPIGSKIGRKADANDLLLVLEYEKGQVDLKLWQTTDKYRNKKFFEIAFAGSAGAKYKSRRKTWEKGNSQCGFTVFEEVKVDDIPFFYDFNKLSVNISDVTVLKTFTGADVYNAHGWTQPFTYAEAKTKVQNIHVNDKHQTISMLEENGLFMVDFDKNNIDFMWGIYEADAVKGIVADMVYTPHGKCKVREVSFFSKPKEYGTAKIGMRIRIEDITATGSIAAGDFEITTFQKSNTESIPILSVLPLI